MKQLNDVMLRERELSQEKKFMRKSDDDRQVIEISDLLCQKNRWTG
jgi:hypothetical protein